MKSEINIIWDKLEGWYTSFIVMAPNILVAIVAFIASVFIARGVKYAFEKWIFGKWENTELKSIFGKILKIVVICLGFLFALSLVNLDKTVTSVLAGVGVIGLALGFAFQDIAANFISGIFMASNKPFEIGDSIEVAGVSGIVMEIKLRTTEIRTFAGNDVIVPNQTIFQNAITNYTSSPSRRIDLAVGVSYSDNLQKVKEVTMEVIKNMEGVMSSKDVQIFYTEFGGSSINFDVRFWINHGHKAKFLEYRSNAIEQIKLAYDENGFNIPFPIRTLDLADSKGILKDVFSKNTSEGENKIA